jgi:hypothetical protein
MGKVVSLSRAKNRRDKKYDPYKLNPLSTKLTKAVSTDETKPKFDVMEWESSSAQIHAIWTCFKIALETTNVVPPNEAEACIEIMAEIAKLDRKTKKPYKVSLPINLYVGTYHVMNACRMFHVFHEDQAMDKAIDGLTMDFAKRIDLYHEVKRRETVEEKVKPDNILSLTNKSYYKDSTPKVSLEAPKIATEKED